MKHFDFEPVQTNGASPAAKAQQKRKKALIAELLKTAVFALAALTTLVAATIAWFVSNNLVQSGTSTVSAGVETVKLASTGKRQEAESAYLRVDGAPLPCSPQEHFRYRLPEAVVGIARDQLDAFHASLAYPLQELLP